MQASDNASGADNQQERLLDPWYVTGFFEGEGCFSVSIHYRPTITNGWMIRPVLQAYQHRDRVEILEKLVEFFGCGKIRPKGPQSSVLTFAVERTEKIINNILPHFDRYPLQSTKQLDYLKFREIALRMYRKEHKDPTVFLEIARTAFSMNLQGKQRKHTLADLESRILRGHTPDLTIR
jgi:hypothetical protein